MLTRRSGTEQGFTLIEMVIATALMTVVFAMAALFASSMFVGSSKSNASRLSAQRAATVLERFERDVRYAQSPDVLDRPRSGDDLRGMLLWGQSRDASDNVVVTSPQDCSQSLEVASRDFCRFEDITSATATELWVRSDVRNATAADDGVECVRWEIRAGALWRTVHRAGPEPDCRRVAGGTRLGEQVESERLLEAPSTTQNGNSEQRAASLGYLVTWNPAAAGSAVGAIVDPSGCRTQQTDYATAPTGRQRTFVSTVTLDLASNTQGGKDTSSRSRYAVSAALMGRANDEYVRAAGCAY